MNDCWRGQSRTGCRTSLVEFPHISGITVIELTVCGVVLLKGLDGRDHVLLPI